MGLRTVCAVNMCTGCMACIQKCHADAINIKDDLKYYNAIIDEGKCVNCRICYNVCPQNNHVKFRKTINACQGWAISDTIRSECSSGGAAYAISKAFIDNGGVVCSCCFTNGEFVFEIAEKTLELRKFRGSKYVKSNPINAYKLIDFKLLKGDRVLFIGLPCQVAGVLNYTAKNFRKENLYTIDLICHGTPSPKILNKYLSEINISVRQISNILFRDKSIFQICIGNKPIGVKGVSDSYTLAFLNSLFYTDNCYECMYANRDRVSDITLGDSWGSQLPIEERNKGLSLLLIQTKKGDELLKESCIHIEEVDMEIAVKNNHQLIHPSSPNKNRESFFKGINKGKKIKSMVRKCLPKLYCKQIVKAVMIKTNLYKKD